MKSDSRIRLRFPVLMYHRIESDECPVLDGDEAGYAVPIEEFEWQMGAIREAGLRGLTVEEAGREMAASGKDLDFVVLSFDDGNRSDFVHALPVLQRHSLKATFFLTTCRVGEGRELENSMVNALVAGGMEVGSHGVTHRFLPALEEDEKVEECRRSREILGVLAGKDITSFSPPGGRFDDESVLAVKEAGYKMVCTSEFGFNNRRSNPMGLKRIPVTRKTGRKNFLAILNGEIFKLSRLYVRYHALGLIRSAVGEKAYSALRSKLAGRRP